MNHKYFLQERVTYTCLYLVLVTIFLVMGIEIIKHRETLNKHVKFILTT